MCSLSAFYKDSRFYTYLYICLVPLSSFPLSNLWSLSLCCTVVWYKVLLFISHAGIALSENSVLQHFEEHPILSDRERVRLSFPRSFTARKSGCLAWPPESNLTLAMTDRRGAGEPKVEPFGENRSVVKLGQKAKNHLQNSTVSFRFGAFNCIANITLFFCPGNQSGRFHAAAVVPISRCAYVLLDWKHQDPVWAASVFSRRPWLMIKSWDNFFSGLSAGHLTHQNFGWVLNRASVCKIRSRHSWEVPHWCL